MKPKSVSEFPQEVLNLFDRCVHGGISRREFLDRAGKFAVGGMTSTAMFERLWPNYQATPGQARSQAADKKLYAELQKKLRGNVIVPGDPDYDQHRRVWNLDADRHPAAIARCVDENDVQAAVRFAKDAGVKDVAVRGGGHSYAGLSTCDNGLVIDLGLMQKARAGNNNRIFVQGGAHLSHLYEVANQMGSAVPAGVELGTGIGGLSLGGGVGNLQRRFGLTCDNLRSVRMVTADGKIVVADDKTEPELMWGLRGAGWNFGIVTEFEFQSYPINPAFTSGLLVFPSDIQEDFAKFFDGFVQNLPKDVASILLMPRLSPQAIQGVASAATPSGVPAGNFFGVNTLWVGPPDGAAAAFKPLLDWKPVANVSRPTTFAQVHRLGSPPQAPQNRYVRGGYLDGVGTGILTACGKMMDKGAPPGMGFVFSVMGGAIKDMGEQDTAFSGRSAKYFYALEVSWKEPSQREPTLAFVRETHDAMEKFATGGEYTNTVTDEGSPDKQGLRGIPPREARVRRVYGDEKFARLQRLKSHWDPKNLFHVNLNVSPEKTRTTASRG